jgi:hypothetical protein
MIVKTTETASTHHRVVWRATTLPRPPPHSLSKWEVRGSTTTPPPGIYDLLVKREVENKTEKHKTDSWENQRQFFSQIVLNKIFFTGKDWK